MNVAAATMVSIADISQFKKFVFSTLFFDKKQYTRLYIVTTLCTRVMRDKPSIVNTNNLKICRVSIYDSKKYINGRTQIYDRGCARAIPDHVMKVTDRESAKISN